MEFIKQSIKILINSFLKYELNRHCYLLYIYIKLPVPKKFGEEFSYSLDELLIAGFINN